MKEGGQGAIRRSAQLLMQAPLADINAATITRLRELHPTAVKQMGDIPTNRSLQLVAIDDKPHFSLLKRRVRSLVVHTCNGVEH